MELDIVFHARERMKQRGVSEHDIKATISKPDITRPGNKPGRKVYERDLGRIVCVVTVDNTNPIKIVSVWIKKDE
ncbi:DUF4258 domain-containing protein [Corynebacterium lubricantis]|uniref:DUF4258 domain-containing protein n=1 Tax=Corynebacterium lubricantis TaxID=541095 RepID=UPI0004758519|nr:DUF4258 domain-containing protein [Corynebacterium lubricantis]